PVSVLSAGKHRSGKTRNGNRWLRAALVEAALGATRTKTAPWRRGTVASSGIAGIRTPMIAIAHNVLVTAYHIVARHATYQELGPTTTTVATPNASPDGPCRLEQHGYRVTLERVAWRRGHFLRKART